MPKLLRGAPSNLSRKEKEAVEEPVEEPVDEPIDDTGSVQEAYSSVEPEEHEEHPSSQSSELSVQDESMATIKETFKEYFLIPERPNNRFLSKLTELERDEEGNVLFPLFEEVHSWKFHWYA